MKYSEKTSNAYANGLMKATEHIIRFCQKEISIIKSGNPVKNSPRQITNGGKLLAYNKVLVKLKTKRENIIKRKLP